MFGCAITGTGCSERPFVGLRGDMDANNAGVFTVLSCDPGSQARAGTKHGGIGGEHVADELLNARSASRCGQVLDEQLADAVALPGVVDQDCDLSLGAVQDLV